MPETEFDTQPQWSEDGHYWWDGQQWLLADEARARSAEILAMSGELAAYLPPVELPPTRRNPRVLATVAGVLALLVLATVLVVVLRPEKKPDDLTPVKQTLTSAFAAEKAHRVRAKRYTADLFELMRAGYHPLPGVTLSIIRADRRSYCLKAGKGEAQLYLASDASTAAPQLSPTPCV